MLKLYSRQWRDSQLIMLAEQKTKREYNSVLIQLAQLQARELNAAVAGRQEIESLGVTVSHHGRMNHFLVVR
jgi:ABC-type Fe3+-siderophore transport system permease subunit